jgi:acetolactate synthase-1/2/3 large subunit
MGLGGFPGNHKLFMGMPGMHGAKAANYALQECDLIISIGARFDDRVTGYVAKFAPNALVIHIDVDPSAISKIIKVDIPIVGDAKRILTAINEIVKPRASDSWNDKIDKWKGERLFSYTRSEEEIKPQAVIEAVYNETKGEAIITTEVGQHQMWTAQYFSFIKPRTLLTSGGLGTMGFGLPAAMGAAFADNNKPVIVIAGDGSVQMNIQELATLSLNNIPVKIVILNNSYLGMVRQWQELFCDRRYSCTSLSSPDYIQLANSFGIDARRVVKRDQLVPGLNAMLKAKQTFLLEVCVEQGELELDLGVARGDERQALGPGLRVGGAGDELVRLDAKQAGQQGDGALRRLAHARLEVRHGGAAHGEAVGELLLRPAPSAPQPGDAPAELDERGVGRLPRGRRR